MAFVKEPDLLTTVFSIQLLGCLKYPSENIMIIKMSHFKRKPNFLEMWHLHGERLVPVTDSGYRSVRHRSEKRGIKQLFPLQCPAGVNFFNIALQVEDISPVIFLQYFSVILFFSPLHFFPGDCSMWQSELCVITQQETISLPHICCQGSAKNGAVLGLSDLTTSHRAPELPTPGWGKSNTTS